jgi:hypothetical protein
MIKEGDPVAGASAPALAEPRMTRAADSAGRWRGARPGDPADSGADDMREGNQRRFPDQTASG